MDFGTEVIITRGSLVTLCSWGRGWGAWEKDPESSVHFSHCARLSLPLPMKPTLCVRHCAKFWGHPGSETDMFLLSFWLRTHKRKRRNK